MFPCIFIIIKIERTLKVQFNAKKNDIYVKEMLKGTASFTEENLKQQTLRVFLA